MSKRGIEGADPGWMITLGELAIGIVHDFNNILFVIENNADMLEQCDLDDEAKKHIHQINAACDKGAAMTKNLLAFSRNDKIKFQPSDLNELIRQSLTVVGPSITSGANLNFTPRRDPLEVMCSPIGMVMIFINILINAGHATVSTSSPEIGITTDRIDDKAIIEIRNNGEPIEENTLKHIFEFGITTKPRGSGIGLSTSKRIVDEHGGEIHARNLPEGKGVAMTIIIPVDQNELFE